MSANEKKVAHYQATIQHWDYVIKSGIDYLRGNASKYIFRWRDKGGIADLEKAAHYIQKLLESFTDDRESRFGSMRYGKVVAAQATAEFIRCNDIPVLEATALSFLVTYDDVALAEEAVRKLIDKATKEGFEPAGPETKNEECERCKINLAAAEETATALRTQAEEHHTKMAELAEGLIQARAEIATLTTAIGFTAAPRKRK